MQYMNKVFLLIGGNIGDRLKFLEEAIELVDLTCGDILQRSAVYETAAWGKTDQAPFLNQALLLHTSSTAQELISNILVVEEIMGRHRTEKFGPRVIDIDILFFNEEIIKEPNLTIPHPELQNRRFVLVPLQEIAPGFVHPVLQKTVEQLLEECPDKLAVSLLVR